MPAKYDARAVLTMLLKSAKGEAKKAIQAEIAKKQATAKAEWLLRMAGEVGDVAAGRALLDGGVKPNVVARWPWLHLFKENVARLLLEAGIDKNAKKGHWLCCAADCGTPKMVQLLVDHGADLNLTGDGHRTPLIRAALAGRTEVARILIEKGADPNRTDKTGSTALMAAAHHGKSDLVTLLLKAGAAVDAERDPTQGTALEEAVAGKGRSRLQAVLALIAAGAAVNHRGPWPVPRVLHLACRAGGDAAIVQNLIICGADLRSNMPGFGTPLHEAARSNRPDIVQVLLDAGADPEAVVPPQQDRANEEAGLTPLELARLLKARKVIPVLESVGAAKPTKSAKKTTPAASRPPRR